MTDTTETPALAAVPDDHGGEHQHEVVTPVDDLPMLSHLSAGSFGYTADASADQHGAFVALRFEHATGNTVLRVPIEAAMSMSQALAQEAAMAKARQIIMAGMMEAQAQAEAEQAKADEKPKAPRKRASRAKAKAPQ